MTKTANQLMAEAKAYVVEHAVECATELLEWKSRGELKGNRMREAAAMITEVYPHDDLQLVEGMVVREALRLVSEARLTGWRSRLESLPEPQQSVVFAGIKHAVEGPGKRYTALGYMDERGWWHGAGWCVDHSRVSHWMPAELPQLTPEEEIVLHKASFKIRD